NDRWVIRLLLDEAGKKLTDSVPLCALLQDLACRKERVVHDVVGRGRLVGADICRDGFRLLLACGIGVPEKRKHFGELRVLWELLFPRLKSDDHLVVKRGSILANGEAIFRVREEGTAWMLRDVIRQLTHGLLIFPAEKRAERDSILRLFRVCALWEFVQVF